MKSVSFCMLRLDRTITRKTSLRHNQDAEDVLYWRSKTVEERMEALEFLRRQAFAFYFVGNGTGKLAYAGIQRVCRVIKRKQR